VLLSPKTVERHLSNIFAKLGVENRAAIGRSLAAEDRRANG
jgi:DNA-binding NarL/FixJ family response regulator